QVKIALDTSDKPMEEIAKNLSTAAPDLIKPNGLELGQLVGEDGLALEAAAEGGDYSGVIAAARKVNAQGVGYVLVRSAQPVPCWLPRLGLGLLAPHRLKLPLPSALAIVL